MNHIKVKNYEQMSNVVADIITAQLLRKPHSVLGLATGSTPLGCYEQLCKRCKNGSITFRQARTVNLDEYCGLAPDHPQSYKFFMHQNLFDHIDILPQNIKVPDGLAQDIEEECRQYDAYIAALGGVDLQLLGMGNNGHIGFNEPAEQFTAETHLVDLTESTIQANARFFENDEAQVPKQAITMGVKSIMQAGTILLAVNSPEKKQVLEMALYGPVTPQIPASLLQVHKELVVVSVEG